MNPDIPEANVPGGFRIWAEAQGSARWGDWLLSDVFASYFKEGEAARLNRCLEVLRGIELPTPRRIYSRDFVADLGGTSPPGPDLLELWLWILRMGMGDDETIIDYLRQRFTVCLQAHGDETRKLLLHHTERAWTRSIVPLRKGLGLEDRLPGLSWTHSSLSGTGAEWVARCLLPRAGYDIAVLREAWLLMGFPGGTRSERDAVAVKARPVPSLPTQLQVCARYSLYGCDRARKRVLLYSPLKDDDAFFESKIEDVRLRDGGLPLTCWSSNHSKIFLTPLGARPPTSLYTRSTWGILIGRLADLIEDARVGCVLPSWRGQAVRKHFFPHTSRVFANLFRCMDAAMWPTKMVLDIDVRAARVPKMLAPMRRPRSLQLRLLDDAEETHGES